MSVISRLLASGSWLLATGLFALLLATPLSFSVPSTCPDCINIDQYLPSGFMSNTDYSSEKVTISFYYENASKTPPRNPVKNAPVLYSISHYDAATGKELLDEVDVVET